MHLNDFPEIRVGTLNMNPDNGMLFFRSNAPGSGGSMVSVTGEHLGLLLGFTVRGQGSEIALQAPEAREIAALLTESAAIVDGTNRGVNSLHYRPKRKPMHKQLTIAADEVEIELAITDGYSIIGAVVGAEVAREVAFALTTGAQMLDDLAAAGK
jgi:hypothetical protein